MKNVDDNITAMRRRLDEVYGSQAKVVDIIMNEMLVPVAENDHCSLVALTNIVDTWT